MENSEYFELLKKFQVPTEQDIDRFLSLFAYEHSWYEHLTDERERLFIFFIAPPSDKNQERATLNYGWDNFISWDEEIDGEKELFETIQSNYKIPSEILEFGKIRLSKFIHESAFSNAFDYYLETPIRKSFAELHQKITCDLRMHINQLVKSVISK